MTGTTPLYGIRFPDSTTKLTALGPELATFAGDVERVLQSVEIPAAAALPAVVAATQAARDQAWGVPSTDTQRRNLQNRGATTIRTDKGWTERYFAAWHATNNPGGATPAGWYPIGGEGPVFSINGTGNQPFPSSGGWVLLNDLWGNSPQLNAGGFLFGGGALTVPLTGMYQLLCSVNRPIDDLQSVQITRNNPNPDQGTVAKAEGRGYTVQAATIATPLSAGDVLRAFAVARGTTAPSGVGGNLFAARYLGPTR